MSQFKLVNDSLIGWVPSTKCTNNESIEVYTIYRSTVVLRQESIFLLLFLSCSLKGSLSILEWHSDVYNSHRLASVIDCNKVGRRDPSRPGTDWLNLTVVDTEELKALTSLY